MRQAPLLNYADRDDVLSRAGRVGGAFSVAGRRPNLTDIDQLIDDCASDVDEAIRGAGFDPTALDLNAQAGLKDLVASGALSRALRALGDRSPEVLSILTEAEATWTAAMGDPASRQPDAIKGSIAIGSFPVIAALLAGAGGEPTIQGGSFWEDEPSYGRPFEAQSEWLQLHGTNLAPGFSRGQKL